MTIFAPLTIRLFVSTFIWGEDDNNRSVIQYACPSINLFGRRMTIIAPSTIRLSVSKFVWGEDDNDRSAIQYACPSINSFGGEDDHDSSLNNLFACYQIRLGGG